MSDVDHATVAARRPRGGDGTAPTRRRGPVQVCHMVVGPVVAGLVLAVTGCASSTESVTPAPSTSAATPEPSSELTPQVTSPSDPANAPVDVGRVVVLGEEFALADVLALGVEPVASTATVSSGFRGIERDTSDIEVLSATEPDLERLVALEPDTIVTYPYLVDAVGRDTLEQLGRLVVLPDTGFRADVMTMADAFGVPERGEALVASYDDAVATADEDLRDDLRVSMVTAYAGDNLAIWADGPVNVPATLQDAGITLSPGPDDLDDLDDNGRAWVSTEQLRLLDGDALVTLQTSTVEGEDAAVASVRSSPLWSAIPAVEADRVIQLDRLGYPGVEGRIRLAEELPDLLGATGS